jgi:hypothetical protein
LSKNDNKKRRHLVYDVPAHRVQLDWEAIELIAKHKFPDSTRISIESHLRWFRDQTNYYDTKWNPNDYQRALDALKKVSQTPGHWERWEGMEEPLNEVMGALEEFARPWDDEFEVAQFGEYEEARALYILLFQLWHGIGESGIKLTRLKGVSQSIHGNDKVLTDAQLTLREVCQQGIADFDRSQNDEAFARQLTRSLKFAKKRGDTPVAPAVPVC